MNHKKYEHSYWISVYLQPLFKFFLHHYEIIQNAKSVNTIKNVVKIYLTNNTNLYYQIIQNNNINSIDLYINEFSPW